MRTSSHHFLDPCAPCITNPASQATKIPSLVLREDLRMVHSAVTITGPKEKWVVPIWSLQAGWLTLGRGVLSFSPNVLPYHESRVIHSVHIQTTDILKYF